MFGWVLVSACIVWLVGIRCNRKYCAEVGGLACWWRLPCSLFAPRISL